MKPRKASDLRQLSDEELQRSIVEATETLTSLRFQAALAQLQDTAYLNILRKDIARMKMILHERTLGAQSTEA